MGKYFAESTAIHKIGKVTYTVCSHSSETATDSLDKKIRKFIQKDVVNFAENVA
ncbi:MAG: hypothetical protein R3Y63_13690 [Eubacteriales bacterium]